MLKKNIISRDFINKINSKLDNYQYDKSLFFFQQNNPLLISYIKRCLIKGKTFDHLNLSDCYIVIRCVKPLSHKRSFTAHFDNYKTTILIPLKVPDKEPKGQIFVWNNTRRMPINIFEHLVIKILFQNFLFRFFLKKGIFKKFKKIDVECGDFVSFNGFVSLHYNQSTSDERRSILIHCDKGFKNSLVLDLSDKIGQFIMKLFK